MMERIPIVGVDPSLRNFGIVRAMLDLYDLTFEVQDLILVQPKEGDNKKSVRKNSDDLRRAMALHEGFAQACKGAQICFAEVPVGSQSARAMASYGMCLGVLAACSIPLIQVTPTEVKLAGTGEATATKEEMIEAAVAEHPLAPWRRQERNGQKFKKGDLKADNEHLADALYAIKAGVQTADFRAMTAMARGLHGSVAPA